MLPSTMVVALSLGFFPPATAAKLQSAVDAGVGQQPMLGAALTAVVPGLGAWVGASGYANAKKTTKMAVTHRLRIASVTKTFTAALILLSADEGRLSIDDQVSRWFPDFPRAREVTVRNLLNMTSGIRDYTMIGGLDLTRPLAPSDLVSAAAGVPYDFSPGADWGYSNTNYTLLGLILEKVSGQSYAQLLRSRLLAPLGLNDTFLAGYEDVPGGFAPGFELEDDGGYVDVTAMENPTVAYADGGLVSTPSDLARWFGALFGGQVLPAAQLARMTARTRVGRRTVDFGLGLHIDPESFSYAGTIVGFSSDVVWFPANGLVVAALSNTSEDRNHSARSLVALALAALEDQ